MKDSKHIHDTLDYIHNNPVHAGFVEKAEDYLYSSARYYYGLKGMIGITMLEPLLVSGTSTQPSVSAAYLRQTGETI